MTIMMGFAEMLRWEGGMTCRGRALRAGLKETGVRKPSVLVWEMRSGMGWGEMMDVLAPRA